VKNTRLALLEHIGPNATLPQQALIERIAFLELRAAIFDMKQVQGTFTPNDTAVHLAIINSLRRLYQTLGLQLLSIADRFYTSAEELDRKVELAVLRSNPCASWRRRWPTMRRNRTFLSAWR
jgi:hypothetical protein